MLIFVVGNARSGTTLMARVLGRHSRICTFRELDFFEQRWVPDRGRERLDRRGALRLLGQLMKRNELGLYSKADPADFYPAAERLLEHQGSLTGPLDLYLAYLQYETARQGKEIPLTQTPRNLFYLDEILERIEGARVIWMVRDPRAVLCSQKYRWRRSLWRRWSPSRADAFRSWINYHPITYSLLWRAGCRQGSRFLGSPSVRQQSFESLIEDPERQVASLLDWLGLAHETGLLEVKQRFSSHHPDRPTSKGIDTKVLDRWRQACLRPSEIALCQRIAGAEMAAFNYAPEPARFNPLLLLWYLVSWLPRTGLAFLLNLTRTVDPVSTLRRRLGFGPSRAR